LLNKSKRRLLIFNVTVMKRISWWRGWSLFKPLVVDHDAVLVHPYRILRAAERIIKCLQEGDCLNEDKCNCWATLYE
jgi:hypothetical protein